MSEDTATEHMTFTDAAGDPMTGKTERNRFMGHEPMPKPEPEPEKTYEGHNSVEDAANDLSRRAGLQPNRRRMAQPLAICLA